MNVAITFDRVEHRLPDLEEEKKKADYIEDLLKALATSAAEDITGMEDPALYRLCCNKALNVKESIGFRREFLENMITELRRVKEHGRQTMDEIDRLISPLEDE